MTGCYSIAKLKPAKLKDIKVGTRLFLNTGSYFNIKNETDCKWVYKTMLNIEYFGEEVIYSIPEHIKVRR